MNLPFSKLQIKIHALDNPTSVFKKRHLLSLNCINKVNPKKKNTTPIRNFTDNLPHYMLPLKNNLSHKNNSNYNSKGKTNEKINTSAHLKNKKLKGLKSNLNNSKIKLPHLSREKSAHNILYSKINANRNNISNIKRNSKQDISIPNINNSFHNIKINDNNNSNIEIFNNNEKKNSLKDNNVKENIYSNNNNLNDTNNEEQNNNYPSINNYSSDSGSYNNIPKQFQSIISDLQKKINKQKKLLSERKKEIEILKKQINDNENDKDIIKNNYYNDNIEDINNNKVYEKENELLNKEIERYKSLLNDYKKNNQEKNHQNEINKEMIDKLKEELKTLKENIESLSDKYQNELNNNKILEAKYNYLKNTTKTPEELTESYKNKIKELENSKVKLEEELFQIRNKKYNFKKSKTLTLELLANLNNNKDKLKMAKTLKKEFIIKLEILTGNSNHNNNINDSKTKTLLSSKNFSSENGIQNELILSEKEYKKIQFLLNIILILNGIKEEFIRDKIIQLENKKKDAQINSDLNDLCQNLKISNKDLIKQFMNDFLIKEKKGLNALKALFKYNKTNLDENIDGESKKNIFEKCITYDYKNKKTIPFNYFKHLYKENCHNKMKSFSEKQFFHIIYECKLQKNNNIYSIFDIFYGNLKEDDSKKNEQEKKEKIINEQKDNNSEKNNLINSYEINNKDEINNNDDKIKNNVINNDEIKNDEVNEISNINNKLNPPHKLKYQDLIQNFLDKVIKEAIEKQKDDDDDSVKARSFDQDIYNKLILQIDNNNISKMNKSSSDGEDNDFDI